MRLPRALGGEDEPGQVRSRFRRRGHVLLPREPADLDERPGDELAELRGGIGRAHERGADEHRVRAGELGERRLRARRDAALGDDDAIARSARDEVELRLPVDPERAEISRVEADRIRSQPHGPLELGGVVRLDQRVEPELGGTRQQPPRLLVVEVAQEEERRVRSGLAHLAEILLAREEPLREQRKRGRRRGQRGDRRPIRAKRSSTRIDTAAAPARSNAAASCAGSASGRRSPADGERRLTSAIAARPGACSAARRRPLMPPPPTPARTR